MDLSSAARAVALAASLAGIDAPRAPLAPAAVPAHAASGSALVTVRRVPLAAAQAARDASFVRKPVGLSQIEAAITADGSGDFWIRLRQDGQSVALPVSRLEGGARACFPAACYEASADAGVLTVSPENGQEGLASFRFEELAEKLFSAAPGVKLSDSVEYFPVYEPGPAPAESATFWHRDLTGAVYLAYRTPAELTRNTWLVVIDGVYFGVRRDGADLVFERKAQAGILTWSSARERRLPGT